MTVYSCDNISDKKKTRHSIEYIFKTINGIFVCITKEI